MNKVSVVGYVSVLIILLAGCSVLKCANSKARKLTAAEQSAVDWVEKLGGSVDIGYVYMKGKIAGFSVDLSGTAVNDEELHHLLKLAPRLNSLDLSDTGISGGGLPSIVELAPPEHRSLAALSLRATSLDIDELRRIVRGAEIGRLDLSNTSLTDDGLAALLEADIQRLNIANTRVTAVGLRMLKQMPYLRELSLQGLSLNDKDISILLEVAGKEYNLRRLNLAGTGLSLQAVAKMRQELASSSPETVIDLSE